MIDSKQNPMCETLGDPLVCGRGGGGGAGLLRVRDQQVSKNA